MKEIQLSKIGKYKGMYKVLVDDEDFEYLNQFNWHVGKVRGNNYAKRTIHSNPIKSVKMHRAIMNAPINMQVDHIDHNGLNNQKSNLRLCVNKENACNRKSIGKSKYLGVSHVHYHEANQYS